MLRGEKGSSHKMAEREGGEHRMLAVQGTWSEKWNDRVRRRGKRKVGREKWRKEKCSD